MIEYDYVFVSLFSESYLRHKETHQSFNLHFDSFLQISLVQRYAVIVGMNGAGLMNALFRPEHAVAVQLVPYKAALNHVMFGKLLATVGPYMEWHNAHPQLHRPSNPRRANTSDHLNADTVVNVTEFTQLVQTALVTVKDLILGIKEEL